MSLQNALKLIQQCRVNENKISLTLQSINELVLLSEQENLPCSREDLKKAFQIDWDLRWLKHSKEQ